MPPAPLECPTQIQPPRVGHQHIAAGVPLLDGQVAVAHVAGFGWLLPMRHAEQCNPATIRRLPKPSYTNSLRYELATVTADEPVRIVVLEDPLPIAEQVPVQVIAEAHRHRQPVRGNGRNHQCPCGIAARRHKQIVPIAQRQPRRCGERGVAVNLRAACPFTPSVATAPVRLPLTVRVPLRVMLVSWFSASLVKACASVLLMRDARLPEAS